MKKSDSTDRRKHCTICCLKGRNRFWCFAKILAVVVVVVWLVNMCAGAEHLIFPTGRHQ